MGVVQVVGRADGHVVHAVFLRAAAQFFEVPIEPLATGFPTLGIRDFTTKEGREKRRKLSRNFWQRRAESSVD